MGRPRKAVTDEDIKRVMRELRSRRTPESLAEAGSKGGNARFGKMDKAQKQELARKAAAARWGEGYISQKKARALRKAEREAKRTSQATAALSSESQGS